jgi:hypothetical protein
MKESAMALRSRITLAVVFAAAGTAVVGAQLNPAYLAEIRHEKARGRSEATFTMPAVFDKTVDLVRIARNSDALILREANRNAGTVVARDGAYTWSVFEIERVVRAGQTMSPQARWCNGSFDVLKPKTQIALQFFGGTVQLEGVRVTFTNNWVFDAVGTLRYVAFVRRCTATTGVLNGGPSGWIGLTDSNDLIVRRPTTVADDEVSRLRTLPRLEEWLATHPQ